VVEEKMALESKASFLLNEHIRRVVCSFYGHKQEKSEQFEYFAV
jgi:hypothetical protein